MPGSGLQRRLDLKRFNIFQFGTLPTSGIDKVLDNRSPHKGWLSAADLVIFGVDDLPVVTGMQEDAAAVAAVDATATLTAAEEITASVDAITTTVVAAAAAPTAIPEEPSTDEVVAPQAVMNGVANVSGARLNVRSGPDSGYRIIGKASAGEELAIAARSEDGAWLVIVRDDLPLGAGWVSASLVSLDGAASDLPVSDSIFGSAPTAPAHRRHPPRRRLHRRRPHSRRRVPPVRPG